MARASFVQSSFGAGEWSQAAQGQYASPDYRKAMALCLNGQILDTGAWGRRPGFHLAGPTRGGVAGRLIKFSLREATPYNMEFTDNHLRLWNGLDLATTNDDATVSSISAANPAVVQVAAATGWATGDQVFLNNLGILSPLLQGRLFTLTVVDATHFSLADAITGTAINGATLGWVTPAVLPTISRVKDIITPYTAGSWAPLRSVQAEKVAVLLNGSVRPQLLTATDASPFESFALTPSFFRDGPYLDPVPGGTLATPSALSGIVTLTLSFNAWSATAVYALGDYATTGGVNYRSLINANLNNAPAGSPTAWVAVAATDAVGPSGFQPTDIGRHVRMYSEPSLWDIATTYATGNVVSYQGTYWTALGASTGKVPGNDLTNWTLTPANAAVWTWGVITGLGSSINPNPAGSLNIGTMIEGGGLAAAFDGTASQDDAHSAGLSHTTPGVAASFVLSAGTVPGGAYVGKNFSGATPQSVSSVTVYPSSGSGFFKSILLDGTSIASHGGTDLLYVILRGKATAPVSSSDGTELGRVTLTVNQNTAITIPSNDTATTWNYLWVEYVLASALAAGSLNTVQAVYAAEVQFLAPAGTGSASISVEVLGPNLLYTTAIRTWRLGAYSDTTGWPKCGTYHEGRLWLAGAIDNRFDSSMSDSPYIFSPTGPDGTVASNNGISYTFNAADVNPIFWMEPNQQGIICGTQGGEWLVQASALNQPLTPTSIQAHRVTAVRCANVLPATCEHTTAFVQANGRRLMEYFADVYSGKFAAPNLSVNAKHLAASGVAEIAYQQDLQPVIWARNGAGRLIGISYKRDSLISREGPTLAAWHGHTLGSGRLVESIVVGPSPDGALENLAMVSSDGTTRHVEVMANLFEETDTQLTAWHVDDGLRPSSYDILPHNALATSLALYGLWALNGKTVSVMAGGLDCGDYLVTNGAISVPFGDGVGAGTAGGLFTRAYVSSFADQQMPIAVGFTYTSRGQIVRPHAPAEAGTREGPAFGKRRRCHKLVAQLVSAVAISFGTVFGKLRAARFTTPGKTPYTALQPFSGIWEDEPKDESTFDGSLLAWEISRPQPGIVTAIGGMIETQDQ